MKFIKGVDKNYIELSGERRWETEKAILFFDGKTEGWIPKSKIEDIEEQGGNVVNVTIPEWLAEMKGFL